MVWSESSSAAGAGHRGSGTDGKRGAGQPGDWLDDSFSATEIARIRKLAAEASPSADGEGASPRSTAPLRELSRLLKGRAPFPWAVVQYNLGCELWRLAEKNPSSARLYESARAFRAALQVFSYARTPDEWAMAQRGLGDVLFLIGRRERASALLSEAVDAYRAALRVYIRDRQGADWTGTQERLGDVLYAVGQRESGAAALRAAASAYSACLQMLGADKGEQRLAVQEKFADALVLIGERENNVAWWEVAAGVYRAMTPRDSYFVNVAAELNRAQVLMRVIRRSRHIRRLDALRLEIMALKAKAEEHQELDWVRDIDMVLAQIEVLRWKLNPYF